MKSKLGRCGDRIKQLEADLAGKTKGLDELQRASRDMEKSYGSQIAKLKTQCDHYRKQ
jgi:hypothetical protein